MLPGLFSVDSFDNLVLQYFRQGCVVGAIVACSLLPLFAFTQRRGQEVRYAVF